MADKLNLNVHEIEEIDVIGGTAQIAKPVHPYIRVNSKGEPALYAQHGAVYPEQGKRLNWDDVPGWFWEGLGACNEEALKEVGFTPEMVQNKGVKDEPPPEASEAITEETPEEVPEETPEEAPEETPDNEE